MTKTWKLPASIIWFLAASHPAVAQQQSEEDELAATYGDKSIVSIATGSAQSAAKAPSTASVITARDIQATGSTSLAQVLALIPGINVSRNALTGTPTLEVRGLGTGFSKEVLVLLDGSKLNSTFLGNVTNTGGTFPLENIARIEVIRGPGSALYGADAFSGVINIITKTHDDIHGLEWGGRVGSFNTKDTWIQYGGKLGEVQAAFYLRYGKTDGARKIVDKDLQTTLDGVFGTHISYAPGPHNDLAEELDAHVNLTYGNWKARFDVQDRKLGSYEGIADTLDPVGRFPETRYSAALEYRKENILPNWDLFANYQHYQVISPPGNPPFHIFPPGAFGGAYPDGFIGNPGHYERHDRFQFSPLFTGFKEHKIRLGLGYEKENLYKVEEFKNFSYVKKADGTFDLVPLGRLVNATGNPDLVFLLPHQRILTYFFAQDEWSLAKDWTLTAGLRRDRYSDFGSTTNPRLALVWDAAYNLIIKALHGRAFRAPSFVDQYSVNNPGSIGNPAIKPEKIVTNELGFVYQPTPTLQTNLTFFKYKQSDLIQFQNVGNNNSQMVAQNTGDQTGKGFEFEATWDASRNLRLSGNYSYQRSTDENSGKDAGLAPHKRLFLRSDWHFAPTYQFGATINYVADRKRQPSDIRPPIADYVTTDLSLRKDKLWGNFELQAAIKNLFDRDVRLPTLAPGNIPNDQPQAGRTFYVQLLYKY